jgi:hypothetical protein
LAAKPHDYPSNYCSLCDFRAASLLTATTSFAITVGAALEDVIDAVKLQLRIPANTLSAKYAAGREISLWLARDERPFALWQDLELLFCTPGDVIPSG